MPSPNRKAGSEMTSGTWDPDLFAAVGAAASGVARTLRKEPASAVLFWGDPPEVEVVHQAGLPEDVARALSAGGGAHVADAVRRAGEPLRVRTDALPAGADALAAALRAHDLVALALFPLIGEMGMVGCLLVPLEEADAELGAAKNGWQRACRALAGLQVAAGASALRTILSEDRRRPLGLCDGVVVVDRWERVLLADGIVRELPGWNRADPFGRSLFQLLGGPLLAGVKLSASGALKGEEHVFPPAESHGIPVSIVAVPGRLLDGRLDGSKILLVRDLRPQEARSADSTARVLALGLRVAHAADELARVDARLGGHGIKGGLVEAFLRTAQEVPDLVRQVLDNSVDEKRRGQVDLNESLTQVLDRVRGELEMERVRVFSFLRPEMDAVPCDPLEVLRALRTLVGRARDSLRASGGTLTVRTWSEDGWACAAVSDDGAGVAAPGFASAFKPLFDGQDERLDAELEAVREWAERYGGRFQVERRPRVWNRYTLMLPLERRAEVPASGETRVRRNADGSLEVLVVDDNAALRSVLRRFLERRGHSVTEAVDGDDALGIVSGRSFDRVIVDIQMPGKSGPEFYSCLERVAPQMQDRTLFMTGGIMEDAVEQFLEQSGRPAITKPFDLTELARTVEGVA